MSRLEEVESPDVTFSGERFPIVMSKARGLWVRDVDGNRYRDLTACFGVLALGHGSQTVRNAVRHQLPRLVHGMGDVHPSCAKVELLECLARHSPFVRAKSILGLSGSDAIEAAIKTALVATGRRRFISFSGGYHGLTLGPLALNDRGHFREGFESWLSAEVTTLPFPLDDLGSENLLCSDGAVGLQSLRDRHGLSSGAAVLERLEAELGTKTYAAVVMEPLQGRGGDRTWPEGFVAAVGDMARRYGTLLVFDEIFSGFGRTGMMWGHDSLGVKPDLLCVGKALGGGFPLSACIGEASLMDAWGRSRGEARHTSTFLGHPMACAVGCAVVKEVGRSLPDISKRLLLIESEFERFVAMARSAGLSSKLPFVIRGRGLMRGFWFFEAAEGFAAGLTDDLLELGFLVLPSGLRGDVLSFTPPLTISIADVRAFLAALLRLLLLRAGITP
jgi:4-aminobutyrate aminotransferase/(S)-3-amino-2-methylpropionate transaminase